MIRLLLYVILLAGIAAGLSWMADRPGTLTMNWVGYQVQTSVFIAAILLIAAFVALFFTGWLGVLTWTAPRRFARRMQNRRTRVGDAAVRRGIFAAGAGDRAAALKAHALAKKNVPDEPLTLLLEAQAAQLNEDGIASRQAFEKMLSNPEMTDLALRGLYIEAKKAGQSEASRQFAERALASNPATGWPATALFDMQIRDGDWRGALKTLGLAKQHRHLSKTEADRRRALLLTALAVEIEDTQQSKALAYALEANGMMPGLIAAAAVAGRILAAQGSVPRATKLLDKAWRTAPHPELALIYAHAKTGSSPRDRLARVKALVASGPASLEGDLAVAVAAVEAKDWTAARTALEPHCTNNPPARVSRLMARIEVGQNRDAGRAREWLAKASRGAPDPAWVAPDGTLSREWSPVSPVSGELGVFEWKTPSAAAPGIADEIMDEMEALDVIAAAGAASVEIPVEAELAADESEMQAAVEESPVTASDVVSPAEPLTPASGGGNYPPPAIRRRNANQPVWLEAWRKAGKKPQTAGTAVVPAATPETLPVRANIALRPKTEDEPAQIFSPSQVVDDPGERLPGTGDESTPLTSLRGPT